jgi:hypothetical protein
VFDLLAEGAAFGFEGLIQAVALNIVQPAVIGTSDSTGFDVAVFQRRSSMGTVKAHEPDAAAAVAEQHQLFTQNLDRLRNVFQIFGATNRQPVASEHRAAGRARPHMTKR